MDQQAPNASGAQADGIQQPLGPVDIWVMAVRPKTLLLSIVPVLIGSFWAWHEADAFRAIVVGLSLIGAMAIQIGTNLWNDALDGQRGADGAGRLGPPRVTALGLLPAETVRKGAVAAFFVATLTGIGNIAIGGWPIALLGLAAMLAALAYTGGPFPLAYHGLGEVAVAIFFGGVGVLGTVYLQLGELPRLALVAAVAVAAHASAILVVNNLRDLAGDAAAGKRTMAVRLGENGTLREYRVLIVMPFVLVAAVALTGIERIGWLLPLLLLPSARTLIGMVSTVRGPALNRYLGETAQLGLRFAVLLAGGIALERWI